MFHVSFHNMFSITLHIMFSTSFHIMFHLPLRQYEVRHWCAFRRILGSESRLNSSSASITRSSRCAGDPSHSVWSTWYLQTKTGVIHSLQAETFFNRICLLSIIEFPVQGHNTHVMTSYPGWCKHLTLHRRPRLIAFERHAPRSQWDPPWRDMDTSPPGHACERGAKGERSERL